MRLTFLCRLAMLGSVFGRLAEICMHTNAPLPWVSRKPSAHRQKLATRELHGRARLEEGRGGEKKGGGGGGRGRGGRGGATEELGAHPLQLHASGAALRR